MKTCTKCGQQKPIELFKQRKDGKTDSWCNECYRIASKAYYQKHKDTISKKKQTESYKESKAQWDLAYRQRHAESLNTKKKSYYMENRDRHLRAMRDNYAKNSLAYKQRSLKWKADNRARHNALCMERYTAKMQSRLPWAKELTDLACKEAYDKAERLQELTGVAHDVDHIVPLKSKTVCGLHIYSNLQVLPASHNRSKKNHYWPDQWLQNKR